MYFSDGPTVWRTIEATFPRIYIFFSRIYIFHTNIDIRYSNMNSLHSNIKSVFGREKNDIRDRCSHSDFDFVFGCEISKPEVRGQVTGLPVRQKITK